MKVFHQDESNRDFQYYIKRIERIEKLSTPSHLEAKHCSAANARISRRMMEISLTLSPGEACLYATDSGNIVRLYRRLDYPNQIDVLWNPDD